MKSFALLICLLFCIFSLSIAQECNIDYDEYAETVCEVVTDENGEESQECSSTAPPSHEKQLSRLDNSFTETRFPVETFGWSGNCDCTVTFWQDNNGRGCYVKRNFGRDGDGRIHTSDVLKVRAGSLTIACQFEL